MAKVGIIMGSKSDLPIMQEAVNILEDFGISNEVDIVSAHRTPDKMMEYGKNAHKRGISVIIAGAGGAAHLPGMIASLTPLPVIGVPIKSRNSIDGWDSVLSILQMPVVEVHISNTYSREEFRHKSFLSPHVVGIILGFGLKSYDLAISSFLN